MSDLLFYGILVAGMLLITIGCTLLIRSAANATTSNEYPRTQGQPPGRKRLPE